MSLSLISQSYSVGSDDEESCDDGDGGGIYFSSSSPKGSEVRLAKEVKSESAPSGNLNSTDSEPNEVRETERHHKLYTCPFCFTKFDEANGLIRHLPLHVEKKSQHDVEPSLLEPNSAPETNHTNGRSNRKKIIIKSNNLKRENRRHSREMHLRSAFNNDHAIGSRTPDEKPHIIKKEKETTQMNQHGKFRLQSCQVLLTRCDNLLKNETGTASGSMHTNKLGTGPREKKQLVNAPIRNAGRGIWKKTSGTKRISNSKPMSCPVCSKVLSCRTSVTTHLRIHSKEKPYICQVCLRGFAQCGTLTRHMGTHMSRKRHVCPSPKCSKSFANLVSLQAHNASHTGSWRYKCSTCGKGFVQKNSFKYHVYTHTGQKPYPCPTCSQNFRQTATLKRHILIHTGQLPFNCPKCHRSFRHSNSLKRHSLSCPVGTSD